jgi:hypothetical protein
VLNPRFDPRTVAIVDTTVRDVTPAPLTALPSPASQVAKVTSYAPGAIDVKLDKPAEAGQALLVSENYFPGWRAMADGKPASVALMNYNLIGVPLPAGATSIELRFTDAAYEKGKRVTVIALLLAIAAFVGGLVVDRRRPAPQVVPA